MKTSAQSKIFTSVKQPKIYTVLGIFPFVFLAVMVGFFIYAMDSYASNSIYLGDTCTPYNEGWQLVREGRGSKTVSIPFSEADVPAYECISFVNTLPDTVNDRDVIATRLLNQNVTVYIDGKLRYKFAQELDGPYRLDIVSRYIMLDLNEEDAGKRIQIDGYRTVDGSRKYVDFYIGTKSGVIDHYLESNIFAIMMALFFLLLGAMLAVVGLIFRIVSRGAVRIDNIGWILFSVSLWDATQSEFRDLFFTDVKAISLMPTACLLLFVLTITLYFNNLQKGRYGRVFAVYEFALIIFSVAIVILQILHIFDLTRAIYIVFGFIGIMATLMFITIYIDFKRGFVKEYLSICVGVAILSVCGIAQALVFIGDSFSNSAAPLLIGTAAFCVCALVHTISDYFKMDTERKAALASADIRSQFLANMSHEIRTPINAVLGMNEMILRESHESDILNYSADVDSAARVLLVLVNDILDFSKLESGKMTLVETNYQLKPLILAAYNLIKSRAQEKNLEVKLDVEEDMPSKLCGDDVRIKQIVTNLITNAVKYTKKGTVGIKVFKSVSPEGDFLLNVHVSDTGIGIREEEKDKLFEAFARVDEKRNRNIEGTGLGLPITGQLVKLMNGTIEVDSVYGQGSTFKVSIPQRVISLSPIGRITEESFENHVQKKASKDLFIAPEAKILIVDDVAMNLRVATSLLKNTQVQIDTASSGAECLEKICKEYYHMIFLDHMMPGMDGIETFRRMKQLKDENLNQDTPIVMLTANAITGAREQFMEEGFDDYLSKPFAVGDLQKMIIKYLPKELITLKES